MRKIFLKPIVGTATVLLTLGALDPPEVWADDFENPPPPNEPAAPPWNETNIVSVGVFRLIVDTNNTWLPLLAGYPGFNPFQNTLTSPKLIDFNTQIGRSKAYTHGNPNLTIGVPVGHDPSTVLAMGSFPSIPDFFKGAPAPAPTATFNTRKIYTEVRSLLLQSQGLSACSNQNDPIYWVPPGFGGNTPLISAGSLNLLPICPGQVQSYYSGTPPNIAKDFPARSFFDMFVQVTLPLWNLWPGCSLTNGEPMIVQNTNVTRLPPTVVYTHDAPTVAVPVYFTTTLAGQWNAGERFGWLILAGHGVQFDCSTFDAVLTNAFGPGNNQFPGLPVARDDFYGRPLCPPALATYVSVVNARTNVFPVGPLGFRIRNIVHAGLLNPIILPQPGETSLYVATNSAIQLQASSDGGLTWMPINAPATNMVVRVVGRTNTTATRAFDTEMLSLNISGGNLPAGTLIREHPSKASKGLTSVRVQTGGNRMSSFFDVWLQVSTNGGTAWFAADTAATIGMSLPTAYPVTLGPGMNFIANHLTRGYNNINQVLNSTNMPPAMDTATLMKYNNATGDFEAAETFEYGYGWFPGTTILGPGDVAAIYNPSPVPVTIGFSGVMKEPYALPKALERGRTYGYSMLTPSEGTYEAMTGRSPGIGSKMLRWNTTIQNYDTYTYNNGTWSPSNPIVAIGESGFVVGPGASQPCVTISCPSNLVVTSYDGHPVRVAYAPIVSNFCGVGAVSVSCNPPSPGPIGGFPVGTNTVTCTATVGTETTNCSFKVIVSVEAVPPSITVQRGSGNQVTITLSGTSGQPYHLWSATDITQPMSGWSVLTSGTFSGPVVLTYPATEAAQFYRVSSP